MWFLSQQPTTINCAREQLEVKDGKRWTTSPQHISFKDARLLVGSAFAGFSPENGDPILTWLTWPFSPFESEDERRKLYQCLMGFPINESFRKGGMVLGIQDEEGALRTAAVLSEFLVSRDADPPGVLARWMKSFADFICYMKIRHEEGTSMVFKDSSKKSQVDAFSKRGNHLEAEIHKWHRAYGPSEKHWYIGQVAVDPALQGKGYGKETMLVLGELANSCQMSCFLECSGDFRRKFYEKFAYQVVGTEHLVDPTSSDDEGITMYMMTRTPKWG